MSLSVSLPIIVPSGLRSASLSPTVGVAGRALVPMRLLKRFAPLLACCLAACGGAKEPLVTAELVFGDAERSPTTLATLVFPPVCETLTLPEYPEPLLAAGLPPIAVRVDFTIDSSGRPSEVSATVLDPTEHDRIFGQIAEQTVAAWNCEPAAKPPRPGDEVLTPRPIDYRTRVTFRFYSDRAQHAEAVEVEFDPGR